MLPLKSDVDTAPLLYGLSVSRFRLEIHPYTAEIFNSLSIMGTIRYFTSCGTNPLVVVLGHRHEWFDSMVVVWVEGSKFRV